MAACDRPSCSCPRCAARQQCFIVHNQILLLGILIPYHHDDSLELSTFLNPGYLPTGQSAGLGLARIIETVAPPSWYLAVSYPVSRPPLGRQRLGEFGPRRQGAADPAEQLVMLGQSPDRAGWKAHVGDPCYGVSRHRVTRRVTPQHGTDRAGQMIPPQPSGWPGTPRGTAPFRRTVRHDIPSAALARLT